MSLEVPHMFTWRNKKNIYLILPLSRPMHFINCTGAFLMSNHMCLIKSNTIRKMRKMSCHVIGDDPAQSVQSNQGLL